MGVFIFNTYFTPGVKHRLRVRCAGGASLRFLSREELDFKSFKRCSKCFDDKIHLSFFLEIVCELKKRFMGDF